MNTYFITGATGTLGQYLLKEVLKTDPSAQCKLLYQSEKSKSAVADVPADRIEWVEADIRDTLALKKAMQGVDYVIHAAAIVSFDSRDAEDMMDVNVNGTIAIVDACLAAGVKKLCHISSIAAIGRRKDATVIDENTKWEESDENSLYAKTKFFSECEVWRGVAEGLDAVIVNPSVILGVGDWKKSSLQLFEYFLKGKKFCPSGSINYVDVRDVAEASLKLLYSDIKNERYILNGGNTLYKSFFGTIAKYSKLPPPSHILSPFLSEIAWRAAKAISLITGSKPLITKETARASASHYEYANQKIKTQLNFDFRPLDNTISWICSSDSFLKHSNINP